MTDIQQYTQCDGPHRPTVRQLQFILAKIPAHCEIRAISIKGQGGEVVVEVYHDLMDQVYRFNTPEFYDITP